MSTQEMMPPGGRSPPRSGVPVKPPKGKSPTCPRCRRPMTVKQAMPVLFASGMDDVVYGCEECGTEAKRTVKRV